ncbi:hypothetical protein M378DRAFT_155318 [Amanita muscaria Koide BX008]|uniref:RRM domain-containing protein n=1 Tax=Amanita muscaria (strain Koide BX008) TaxID=946122 RepID=A0A0C2XBC4_AMAMK|nr:hypothetical protein M378DRAFT_155318 [Amanita muscaria Koide BX008]
MHDTPYTTPDEDPFSVIPPSRTRKFPDDDCISPSMPPETATSAVEAYIGYPSPSLKPKDDISTVSSYDLAQDSDIPGRPVTPTHTPRHVSTLLHRATSIRNFNLPFSSPHLPTTPVKDSPRTSSRLSFLSKSSRTSKNWTPRSGSNTPQPQHHRSSSTTTVQEMPDNRSNKSSIITTPSKWRPSVFSHFSTPSRSSEPGYPTRGDLLHTPPRQSTSSSDTYINRAGASDSDLGNFFNKLSLVDSVRSRGDISKSQIASTSSVWSQGQTVQTLVSSSTDSPQSGSSQPTLSQWSRSSATFRPYPTVFDEELDGIDEEAELSPPPLKLSSKPQIAYSAGGAFRFSALTKRHKKKRRLVVSGIKPNDVRKFDNLKHWCESFGEVSQITRMPNHDLHVHFRSAEVADTVCRLRAKVFINGVGSVQLSWTYGDKH